MTHAEYMREWRKGHRESVRATSRKGYLANKHLMAERHQKQRGKFSFIAGKFAAHSNMRAKALGVQGRLSGTNVQLIVGPCAYCGGEANGWDHVIPLVRGGSNVTANIVRCCAACNAAKGARTAEEWRTGVHICVNPDAILRGEGIGNSKLRETQVLEIRRLYATGKISQYQLAREYGVNQTTIGKIVRGDIWTHTAGVIQ